MRRGGVLIGGKDGPLGPSRGKTPRLWERSRDPQSKQKPGALTPNI